jgi:hypothetical protein
LPGLSGAERAEHHASGKTPQSAILSAVIFNALIIVALIPLALKGVKYEPKAARAAAPEPADLWLGRRHRALHRHQGHRSGAGGIASVPR